MNPPDNPDDLSTAERILRLQDEWDAIAGDAQDLDLTPEQWREIERRAADLEQNPNDTIPWERVKAELLERLRSGPS